MLDVWIFALLCTLFMAYIVYQNQDWRENWENEPLLHKWWYVATVIILVSFLIGLLMATVSFFV
jgi:H+/Cl- antiporter ClcA